MKKYLLGILMGAIILGSIGVVAATQIQAKDVTYNTVTVESALDDLYLKATTTITNLSIENANKQSTINDLTLQLENKTNKKIYTNSTTSSSPSSVIDIGSGINKILVECYDNNNSYYVTLDKETTAICGYHYLYNGTWYENNRYLDFNSSGELFIGDPRTINLANGSIVQPSNSVMYVKTIWQVNS